MWLLWAGCVVSEYQTTAIESEAATGGAAAPERGDLVACGGEVMTGIDPCDSGEVLRVGVSGGELAARYDLSGSACVLAAQCDQAWAALWITSGDEPCTLPGEGIGLPARLAPDLDYAVCLVAVPLDPGDPARCQLDTSAGSYPLVVDNPIDNG